MNNIYKNEGNKNPIDEIKKFKPVEAKRSKGEVWADLERLMEHPIKETPVYKFNPRKWQLAASIILMIFVSAFLGAKFYTKTVVADFGKQEVAFLPDGSKVKLNAQTSISYHPFWWKVNREVKLAGEAFFEVKKGGKFTVISKIGNTTVVGTSFNIFARDNDYHVTCLTGKVLVLSSQTQQKQLIIPNQMVSVVEEGNLKLNPKVNAKLSTDWTIGKFIFTQVSLNKVFEEISRRYGVELENIGSFEGTYTGNFNKEPNIEVVLNLVCKPFELEYKKLSSGAYTIFKNTP